MAAEQPATHSGRSALRPWIIEAFACGNLAFLAFDVHLAHLVNAYRHPAERIPVVFSVLAALLILPGVLRRQHATGLSRRLGLLVGGLSIVVGVAGMLLHLEDSFFAARTVKSLVYTAPFAAPLAYAGIGLLLILNRLEDGQSKNWGTGVVFLALGGFVGNFALSLADHAQNGFFHPTEWIPVVASAMAVAFLAVQVFRPDDRPLLRASLVVLAAQVLVGVLGFALHVNANAQGPVESLRDRFIYGAPAFAPLLFANLALLAATGIWELSARDKGQSGEAREAPQI
jgi:4-amino-4-deoxy-L-arabinose transferase-like glycosyltransferase